MIPTGIRADELQAPTDAAATRRRKGKGRSADRGMHWARPSPGFRGHARFGVFIALQNWLCVKKARERKWVGSPHDREEGEAGGFGGSREKREGSTTFDENQEGVWPL